MAHLLDPDLDNCVTIISQSIDTITRGILDSNKMREAHMAIEALNNNPNVDLNLKIAYKLISYQGNEDLTQSVKHFGLQLVENCIKYKWNEISNTTRDEIKAVLQKMIYERISGKDLKLLKEGVSKCVVEVMKREWPSNWPQLMTFMLAQKHNNRVLFTIGRLSEELGIFHSPSDHNRRRDMTVELKSNYPAILNYIGECLVSGDSDLCSAALRTLSSFLEWHTFDEPLLVFLCDLLAVDIDPSREKEQLFIKIQTTDCLLTCLFRKGSKKDRLIIMGLFCPKNVTSIFKCIDMVIPKISVNNFFNDNFTLAKRVFSVVTMMGQTAIQLHSVHQLPMEIWQIYIQKMHSLFSLDNYILNAFVLQFWRDLAKSKELQSLITESLLVSLLSIISKKIFKRPYGDLSIPMEFDDEEDYDVFYIKFKVELTDLVRSLTVYREDICFNFASNLLMETQNNERSGPDAITQWEITAHILDAVCFRIINGSLFVHQASSLFGMLLQCDENNLEAGILCCQISCLSTLTIFIPLFLSSNPNLISALLEKVFKLASYGLSREHKDDSSGSIKIVRRNACALFLKIARYHSHIFLPFFGQFKTYIHNTLAVNLEASHHEICTLNDGLIFLSNYLQDHTQQSSFVNELLEPMKWFLNFHFTPANFISTVGLNASPSNFKSTNQMRVKLMYTIVTLSTLLRHIRRKEVLHAPVRAMMNPCFNLLSVLHSLWNQEMIMLCHADYRSIVFAPVTEKDRLILLGLNRNHVEISDTFKSPTIRMQKFLSTIQDNCYSTIGSAYSLITPELYLEFNNISLALTGFENLPQMKLKTLVRSFLKPFLINYPINDLNVLENKFLPFLKQVLPVIFNRIDNSCKAIREREYVDEKTDMGHEIVEEKACRALSIDFLHLLTCLIVAKSDGKPENPVDEDDWEMRESNEQIDITVKKSASYVGNLLIKNLPIITQICFQCLNWPDSIVSSKAATLCEVVLSCLIEHVMVRNPSDCLFLLENICKALGYYGEYGHNCEILLQLIANIYERLIIPMQFESVKDYLIKLSDGNIEKWRQFEENWIRRPTKNRNVQRCRREALKELLDPIIGKSLAMMGRKQQDTSGNSMPTIRRKKTTDVFNDATLYLYELFI